MIKYLLPLLLIINVSFADESIIASDEMLEQSEAAAKSSAITIDDSTLVIELRNEILIQQNRINHYEIMLKIQSNEKKSLVSQAVHILYRIFVLMQENEQTKELKNEIKEFIEKAEKSND